jgi:hypothetical protein
MARSRHADWGTPGGLDRWDADTFEEEHDDYVALGRVVALWAAIALGLFLLAAWVAPV